MTRQHSLTLQRAARRDLDTVVQSGQPLDRTTRALMEPRFGHSFAEVQVHADTQAAETAEALGAHAFTVGQDIVFGAGEYRPETGEGQHLLAHELAHVVQEARFGAPQRQGLSRHGDAAEGDARAAADAVMAGRPASVTAAPGAAVAREDDEGSWFDPGRLWNTVTDNTLSGAVGLMTEASKTAGNFFEGAAGPASGIPALGQALGPLGIISNAMSMGDAVKTGGLQGMGDFVASGMGLVGSIAPTLELGAAGAGALGLEGAAAGLGAAGTALGPVAAVAGSFAGGYQAGKYLDKGVDWIGDKISGNEQGDHSISGALADGMTAADQAISSLWADPSKPAYTQTLGWKLASLFD